MTTGNVAIYNPSKVAVMFNGKELTSVKQVDFKDASLEWAAIEKRAKEFPHACPICGSARAKRKAGGLGRQPQTCGQETCKILRRKAYAERYEKIRGKRNRKHGPSARTKIRIRHLKKMIAAKEAKIDRLSEALGLLRTELTGLLKPEPDQRELFVDAEGNFVVGVP